VKGGGGSVSRVSLKVRPDCSGPGLCSTSTNMISLYAPVHRTRRKQSKIIMKQTGLLHVLTKTTF
jgi:hypothetical protein